MVTAYLGLGSNLGNRKENIEHALTLLKDNGITVIQCSRLIETTPVGGPIDQNKFFNGVVKINTDLTPHQLLDLTKTIERKLGRRKAIVNGPRTIDLDILLYDQIKLQTPLLTIPHPRMFKRDFVMKPLSEIEPRLTAAVIKKMASPPMQSIGEISPKADLANKNKTGREELTHACH